MLDSVQEPDASVPQGIAELPQFVLLTAGAHDGQRRRSIARAHERKRQQSVFDAMHGFGPSGGEKMREEWCALPIMEQTDIDDRGDDPCTNPVPRENPLK